MIKITEYIFFCLMFTLYSCSPNSKQESPKKTQESIKDTLKIQLTSKDTNKNSIQFLDFIPTNYSVLDTVSGDLNLDGISDYILVLKHNGEDTLSDVIDNPSKRLLLILIRDKNNKLQLARRNDNTVYCVDCGGIFGDPFTDIVIKNGYFSVEHYGGSAWRWTRIITYRYSKQENEWFLHKDGSASYHTSNPDSIINRSIKTEKDFGRVKFEDFDIYKEQ